MVIRKWELGKCHSELGSESIQSVTLSLSKDLITYRKDAEMQR